MEALFACTVVLVIAFTFVNGYHDAALSIGNSVVVRSLHPKIALLVAAIFNFVGGLLGQGVAETLVDTIVRMPNDEYDVLRLLVAAMAGALVVNVVTYVWSLPISSTHCLFGGLIGAGFVLGAPMSTRVLIVYVLLPLVLAPTFIYVVSVLVTWLVRVVLRHQAPKPMFRRARSMGGVLTGALSVAHGVLSAQKSGAIMVIATAAFLHGTGSRTYEPLDWGLRVALAGALALGTLLSGWRVVRTVSERLVTLDPIKATTSDVVSSTTLYLAAFLFKMPLSMTYTVLAANAGTHRVRRYAQDHFRTFVPVAGSWLLTIPVTAILSAAIGIPLLLV